MRRYLEGIIENMRDIGGYAVGDKTVKYGKLIRSNVPKNIPEKDLTFLKDMGIRTGIDLRTKAERNETLSVFEKNASFDVYHYEIYGGNTIPNKVEDVPISYISMLEGKESIYNIFKKLTETEMGIIYFCNAGKDRTGVITALILMTLGVKEEDIVSDYVLSATYLKDMLDAFAHNYREDQIREIITPKAEYMIQFLEQFHEKYGNIYHYLHEIGITDADIEIIQNKYVE